MIPESDETEFSHNFILGVFKIMEWGLATLVKPVCAATTNSWVVPVDKLCYKLDHVYLYSILYFNDYNVYMAWSIKKMKADNRPSYFSGIHNWLFTKWRAYFQKALTPIAALCKKLWLQKCLKYLENKLLLQIDHQSLNII